MTYQYSAAALIAAHTAFRTLVDGETGAVTLKVRDVADVLLATITLQDPSMSINGTTGQITLLIAAREESAPASGTADYAELCDGIGGVHLTIDCVAGTVAVPGYVVMNSLNVIAGGPVEVLLATIG